MRQSSQNKVFSAGQGDKFCFFFRLLMAFIASICLLQPLNTFAGAALTFPVIPPTAADAHTTAIIEYLVEQSTTEENSTAINDLKTSMQTLLTELAANNTTLYLGVGSFQDHRSKNPSLLGLLQLSDFLPVTAANKTTLMNAFNNIIPDGSPTIGLAHAQLQRLMIGSDHLSQTLNYNNTANTASTIYSNAKNYAYPEFCYGPYGSHNGDYYTCTLKDLPSPITKACFKPYLVMLTAGKEGTTDYPPTLDSLTKTAFPTYDALFRFSQFAATTNLLPDLPGDHSMPTYLVIYGNQSYYNSAKQVFGVKWPGGAYYSGGTGTMTADVLKKIFYNILNKALSHSGSISNLDFSNESLSSSNNMICYTRYTTGVWSGDVVCQNLNTDGTVGSTLWSAATQMKQKLTTKPDGSTRVILTYNNGGIPFEDITKLSVSMKNDLNNNNTDTNGAQRLSVLRNLNFDKTQPYSANYRQLPMISDILSPDIQYVGQPSANFDTLLANAYPSLATSYKTFKNTTRTPIVCVGANSPTKQCFNATTGDEVLAYIPGSTTGLADFLDPLYNHRNFNSGPSVVADTLLPGSIWATLDVSCGGSSPDLQCNALNISGAQPFSESNASSIVLWEANATKIPDLGNINTVPTVVLYQSGTSDSTVSSLTLLPNGYNSAANKACLIAIPNGSNPTGAAWIKNKDYYEICDTSSSAAGDTALSVRAVDINEDGFPDFLYLTTANGRILRIDHVNTTSVNNWTISAVVANLGKPITSKPLIVLPGTKPASAVTNAPNLMILVGTGQFLTEADRSDTSAQYAVSLFDNIPTNSLSAPITLTKLVQQNLTQVTSLDSTFLTLSNNTVDFSKVSGAYILLQGGNRVLSSPEMYGGNVVFNIVSPPAIYPDCSLNTNGSSEFVFADLFSLSNPLKPVFDSNGDGSVTNADTVGGQIAAGKVFTLGGMFAIPRLIDPYLIENADSINGQAIQTINLSPLGSSIEKRISWQELRE